MKVKVSQILLLAVSSSFHKLQCTRTGNKYVSPNSITAFSKGMMDSPVFAHLEKPPHEYLTRSSKQFSHFVIVNNACHQTVHKLF